MWIRSQDKLCLTKNDAMVIVDNHKNNKKVWSLINVGGFQYNLGTYKSKERALEVLDEIHEKIINLEYGKAYKCLMFNEVVYQMPEA